MSNFRNVSFCLTCGWRSNELKALKSWSCVFTEAMAGLLLPNKTTGRSTAFSTVARISKNRPPSNCFLNDGRQNLPQHRDGSSLSWRYCSWTNKIHSLSISVPSVQYIQDKSCVGHLYSWLFSSNTFSWCTCTFPFKRKNSSEVKVLKNEIVIVTNQSWQK